MEPISPELALIDPELARRNPPCDFPRPVRTEHVPVAPTTPSSGRGGRASGRAALPLVALVLGGLATGGFLAARTLAPTARTASLPTAPTTSAVAPASALSRSAAAQRQVLDLVMGSPPEQLPAELIDRKTGLPTRNLAASCHPATATSFLCDVQLVQPGSPKSFSVRYRPGVIGGARLVWGGRTQP